MALIYNQLGDTEKALVALKEARVQNPGDFDLIVTEANVHYNLNNLEKFRELLEYAAELEPKNVQLQFNLGVIAADNGDFDNATKYYQRALELDPSNVNSYRALLSMREKSILDEQNSLGNSDAENRRYDELAEQKNQLFLKAITYFKKALESNPDDFESAGTLSNIYSALGDDINAKKYREISDGLAQ